MAKSFKDDALPPEVISDVVEGLDGRLHFTSYATTRSPLGRLVDRIRPVRAANRVSRQRLDGIKSRTAHLRAQWDDALRTETLHASEGRTPSDVHAKGIQAVEQAHEEDYLAALMRGSEELGMARKVVRRRKQVGGGLVALTGAAAAAISGRLFGHADSTPPSPSTSQHAPSVTPASATSSPSSTVESSTPTSTPSVNPADFSGIAISDDKTRVVLKTKDRHGNTPKLSTGVFYPGCAGQMVTFQKRTYGKNGKPVDITISASISPVEDFDRNVTTGGISFDIAAYKKGSVDSLSGTMTVTAIGLPKEAKPAELSYLDAGIQGEIDPTAAGKGGRIVFVVRFEGDDLEPVTATTAVHWERSGEKLTVGVEATDRDVDNASSDRTFTVGKDVCI